MTRSTRNQPFCWQEKKVLRCLKKYFVKSELAKFRNLYLTLTEIDSDFNGKPIKFYTKTIAKYSGLSTEWIPEALRKLETLHIITIVENRGEGGEFKGNELIFTPENVLDEKIKTPRKPVNGKPVNGEAVNGQTGTLEDSIILEDSLCEENSLCKKEKKKISNSSSSLASRFPQNNSKPSDTSKSIDNEWILEEETFNNSSSKSNGFGECSEQVEIPKHIHAFIQSAKKVLIDSGALTNSYFKIGAGLGWHRRQIESAILLLQDKEADYWLSVLKWCLTEGDEYQRSIRNLSKLPNHSASYHSSQTNSNGKGLSKAEIAEESRRIRRKYFTRRHYKSDEEYERAMAK